MSTSTAPTSPPPPPAPTPGATGPGGPGNSGPSGPDWSPPPRPRSSRAGLVIVATLVVAVLAVTALVLLAADSTTRERTERFADVTAISLDLDSANVELVAGGTEAVVDSRVRTGRFGGDHHVELRDGTLHVTYDCPFLAGMWFGIGCSGEYRLAVPAGVEVTGQTDNGAISVDGLDGRVAVATSNGRVHLVDTAGDVIVHTSNGQVTGSGLTSTDLQATTSNGDVAVGFATSPDRVRIETSNGSVEVVVPADDTAWAVDTSTSNGEVTTSLPTDPSSAHRLAVRTSNGDIQVHARP